MAGVGPREWPRIETGRRWSGVRGGGGAGASRAPPRPGRWEVIDTQVCGVYARVTGGWEGNRGAPRTGGGSRGRPPASLAWGVAHPAGPDLPRYPQLSRGPPGTEKLPRRLPVTSRGRPAAVVSSRPTC